MKQLLKNALDTSRAKDEVDVFRTLNPRLAKNPILRGEAAPRVPAAVLIPIIERKSGPHIVMNKRASGMPTHAGQIAFPGGKVQEQDANRTQTALREAEEENGIIADKVEVLGRLGAHLGGYNFTVTPILGIIDPKTDFKPCTREVDEIFEVPFDFAMDLNNHAIQEKTDRGVGFFMPTIYYQDYKTWGLTAAMMRSLAESLALAKGEQVKTLAEQAKEFVA